MSTQSLGLVLLLLHFVMAALCALNVYMAVQTGSPFSWAAAAFVAIIALRPLPPR